MNNSKGIGYLFLKLYKIIWYIWAIFWTPVFILLLVDPSFEEPLWAVILTYILFVLIPFLPIYFVKRKIKEEIPEKMKNKGLTFLIGAAGVIILTILILNLLIIPIFEDIVREDSKISELELIVPEIPSYPPFEFQKKPAANTLIEPKYSFYSEIEWYEFYDYSTGVIRIWVENTGDNDLFVYKYAVMPRDFPEGKWNWSDTGLTIYPGEKKYIGMTSIYVGSDIDSFSAKPSFGILARTDNRWYDYKTVFVEGLIEIPVNSTIDKRENYYKTERRNMFILINKLIFPLNSSVRNTAIQITRNHPGPYNIYQVCDLFDYVVNNIGYVSDPRGSEYIASPAETLASGGGDCDDQAVLLAALIDSIGGTPRIYMTKDHMFATVYIGNEENINDIESAVGKYYNTPIKLHYLTDESGIWLILDSTSSYYMGGLPYGAKPTKSDWTFENTASVSVIDIVPNYEELQDSSEGPGFETISAIIIVLLTVSFLLKRGE